MSIELSKKKVFNCVFLELHSQVTAQAEELQTRDNGEKLGEFIMPSFHPSCTC